MSFAEADLRAATSSTAIVPSAPRISPTCAVSSAAPWSDAPRSDPRGQIRRGQIHRGQVAGGPQPDRSGLRLPRSRQITPSAPSPRRGQGARTASAAALSWQAPADGRDYTCAPGAGRISGEGPFSARTIRVHCSPPSRRGRTARRAQPPARRRACLLSGHLTRTATAGRDPPAATRHPLVRALALHGVARPKGSRSHLASPLTPGRGVLIRSVSRRVGSVACVREDASPNKVSVLQSIFTMPARTRRCQADGQLGQAATLGRGTDRRGGREPRARSPATRCRNGMKATSGAIRTGGALQRGHATSRRLAQAAGRPG